MRIFYLPDLGEGLPDAEIIEWYINEGDIVEIDQILVSLETAKATIDIPSPYSGSILKLYGKPHDIIQTGEPLISFDGEETHTQTKDTGTVVGEIQQGNTIIQESPTGIHSQTLRDNIKALPAVRALAKKLNVDLKNVIPSGPNGSITGEDVKNASHKDESSLIILQGVRRAMAISMQKIYSGVVHATIMDDADINHWKEHDDFTLHLIKVIIKACQAEPNLNAHYDHDSLSLKLFKEINLGLAIDTKEGLFVPVLKDIANRSPEELRNQINIFKQKALNQSFKQEELQESTIALSNYGTMAGRYATPVITPPKVAIIGIGSARKAVVPVDDVPAVHKILPISLTFDHRPLTGGESARFLLALKNEIEKK